MAALEEERARSNREQSLREDISGLSLERDLLDMISSNSGNGIPSAQTVREILNQINLDELPF